MKTLETDRLILRDWQPADCDDLFAYASLPEVALNAGWQPHKSIEDSLAAITGLYPDCCYALQLRETGRVIGNIGFYNTSICRIFQCLDGRELGFDLSPAFWGNGLMTEAAQALIGALFDPKSSPISPALRGPLDYLWFAHFPENLRSRRVGERLGFRRLFSRAHPVAQLGSAEKTEVFYLLANPKVFGHSWDQCPKT